MESPAQRCFRIASALEDLSAQEAAALAASEYGTAVALQERAEPLVEYLTSHAEDLAGDAKLAEQMARIHALRGRSEALLSAEIERTRAELREAGAACCRLARVAPVYGGGVVTAPRLQAVG